jgi:hypothetical protein
MGWIGFIIFLMILGSATGGSTGSTPDSSTDCWNSYEADRRRREEEEERRRWMEEEEERRRRQEEEEARIRAMYDEDDGVFGWDPDHGYWL